MPPEVCFKNIVVAQYAGYLDTGIWQVWRVDLETGTLIPPKDLTPDQLRDFQRVFDELFPLNGR